MAAVMGDRTMTAGEVEAALEAVGERLQSGNVRSYISTTLNSSTTSVLDSSGQPLLYRSGGRLKVHFFTCTERGHYRVSTPQDILAETQKLQALDVEKLGTPVLEAGSPAQRQILIDALTRADGNRTKAAQELGIDRNTLRLRLNKCGIDAQAYVKHSGVKGLPVTSFSGAHRGNVPPTVPEIDAIFRNRNGGRPAHLGNLAAARLARRVFPQPVLDVLNERIGQVLVEVLTPYLKVMAAFDDRN
jgi:hypothetical protein